MKLFCRSLLMSVAVLFSFKLSAIDVYWISGDGSWTNASNWSTGTVPTGGEYKVFVTNDTPVTVEIPSSSWRVGAIAFSGADHKITGNGCLCFEKGESDPVIHVDEDITVEVNGLRPWTGDRTMNLVKQGSGTLTTLKAVGETAKRFSALDVAGGVLQLAYNYNDTGSGGDAVRLQRLIVRSGAKVKILVSNQLTNETIVELEDGGVFDFTDKKTRDTVGGFVGFGVVTNLSSATTTMTCGPLKFEGRFFGDSIGIGPFDSSVDIEDGYFVAGASNTFADVKVLLTGGSTTDNPNCYTNVLRFAAGIRDFFVQKIVFNTSVTPVVLEDVDGCPVRVHASLIDDANEESFIGKGDLTLLGPSSYTFTNNAYAADGTLTVANGTMYAGNLKDGFDATGLEKLSGIAVQSNNSFVMRNFDDALWGVKPCITGAGTVNFAGKGAWTIGNLSLTNGTLTVSSDGLATNLTLAGGCSTGLYYTSPDNFTTYITGGEFHFQDKCMINATGNRKYHQTGGKVYGTLQSLGRSCNNEIFYTMTGGYLRSYTDKETVGQYPQGIGLDLSGNAVAELRNQASWSHRLASGGRSHTIRLSDNAYLGVDDFVFGEAACNAVGTIQLDGGVFAAAGYLSPLTGLTADSPLYANINFNGGILRSEFDGNIQWSFYEDCGHMIGRVQRNGAVIDVKRSSPGQTLTLTWPIVSDVGENEIDGGLRKTGYGVLVLQKDCRINGPVRVDCGMLASKYAQGGDSVFGNGDIIVGDAEIGLQSAVAASVCTAEDANLIYRGGSSLSVVKGASLSIGRAGSATSPFVREDRGVLSFSVESKGADIGKDATVTVNGGIALDATTRLPKDPVFERLCVDTSEIKIRKYISGFLTLDDDNRLVRHPNVVEFNPETSTRSTVAKLSAANTAINVDASVGALNLQYDPGTAFTTTTIASGKTLSIGSGEAGSVAPLLFNSLRLGDRGYISITGGTIDFGAAEGVIVLDYNHSWNSYSRIHSKIAGSGGLTITGVVPGRIECVHGYLCLDGENTYTGDTWIKNAMVMVTKPASLGSGGAVHVGGDDVNGSALVFHYSYSGTEFGKDLFLAGSGPHAKLMTNQNYGEHGALVVRKPVKFTGKITLTGDATVALSGACSVSPAVFAGETCGDGCLTLKGSGALRFDAANSYRGGTVIAAGVLEVSDAGTLGSGPVEVREGAQLRFVNKQAKSIPNVITGEGRIICCGAAVAFAEVSGFGGKIEGPGSVSGNNGFTHDSGSETVFTNKLDYTGDTVVSGGTLCLGGLGSQTAPASDAIEFRLDASKAESLDCQDGRVLSWADADGRDVAFTGNIDNAPVFRDATAGGRPSVFFDGSPLRRLVANTSSVTLRTVAMVARIGEGNHPSGWSSVGMIGFFDQDVGLRLYNRTRLKADSMFFDGRLWADGVSNMKTDRALTTDYAYIDLGAESKFRTIKAETVFPEGGKQFCLGDYFGGTYKRSYYGDIAEIIVYDRVLTDEEHEALERYFAGRWDLPVSENVSTNILPVSTGLEIASGATVELAGGYQQLSTLSGSGTLANGGLRQATVVLSSGLSTFTGTVVGDVYLEIAAGATLDLGGGSITVSAIGGSGSVVNGTVTVTGAVYPGGKDAVGTLTFGEDASAVFDGATLFVDGDRSIGTVDAVELNEAVDITGLSLDIPVPGDIAYGTYNLVYSAGGVAGSFADVDMPTRGGWAVEYKQTAAQLSRKNGTVIVVR